MGAQIGYALQAVGLVLLALALLAFVVIYATAREKIG